MERIGYSWVDAIMQNPFALLAIVIALVAMLAPRDIKERDEVAPDQEAHDA